MMRTSSGRTARAARRGILMLSALALLMALLPAATATEQDGVPTRAAAAPKTPAPDDPLPPCIEEDGDQKGACPTQPPEIGISAGGTFSGDGATVSVEIAPTLPACNTWENRDQWVPSPCWSNATISWGSPVHLTEDGDLVSSGAIFTPESGGTYQIKGRSTRVNLYTGDTSTAEKCNGTRSAFNTYVYGGHQANAPWTSISHYALSCELRYEGDRPDDLKGATWIPVTGSLEVEGNQPYDGPTSTKTWVRLSGDMQGDGPVAVCEVKQSPGRPGRFQFDGTESSGEGLKYKWKFGDGETGTGFLTKHTYTKPGDYTATLKVTDNLDKSDTDTCGVEVEANELELVITVGDGETGQLDPDEEVDVTVAAKVTDDALGGFKKAVFVGDPLRFPPERFEVIAAPKFPNDPFKLGPGDVLARTWTLLPLVAGKVTFRSTITALDPLGEKVTVDAEANERVGDPIEVEVELTPETLTVPETIEEQPAEGGDGEGEPVEVVAAVTIANEGEEDVTGVLWPEKMDVAGIDSSTSPNVRIRALEGPRLPEGDLGPVDMGPFTLEGGESRSLEYLVEVLDDGEFEVKALLQYDDPLGGAPLFALGRDTLGANPDALLGMKLTTAKGQELDWLVGGEKVVLQGDIYNFSSTDTLEVDLSSIVPLTERNAVVLPYRPLDHDVVEEECYLPPTEWIIEPGERLPIHGLLITAAEGSTRGEVEFELPDAVAIDEKNVRTELDPEEYKVSPEPPVFTYQVDTSVETITEWSAADWATFGASLTFGFIDGGVEWTVSSMRGVADLIEAASSWENIAAAGSWLAASSLKSAEMWIEFWVLMGPKQKAAFVADVGQKAYDLAIEAGQTATDAEFQRKAAEAILPGWFDQIEGAYASNSPQSMGEAFGRVAGNVGLEVASCLLPTPKWKGKYQQLATKAGDEAAEAAAAIGRTAKAGSKSAQLQAARLAIPNGALIDATTASTLWTLGSQPYRTLIKFADDNKLLITLRDRGAGSLKRLAEGFIEKMEHMKLKNVNMDIDGPLGYLDSHADTVAFKKPISKAELDSELAKVSDPDLRKEISDRHATRTKEWDEYGDLYRSWEENGFPAGFEYGANGAPGGRVISRLPFRLRPATNAAGEVIPDYFLPEVFTSAAPPHTAQQWRGFTGDIDIVDIRHASGHSVSREHARWIYDQLKDGPVTLRHGDTIHWVESPSFDAATQFKIKVKQLKDFFVDGPDKLLQIAPDGARAVQLDPEKSFVAVQKAGAPSDRGTYATYAGGYKQRVTTVQIAGQTIEASWGSLNPIAPWLAPADWIIEGGTEENPLGVCQPRRVGGRRPHPSPECHRRRSGGLRER